MVAVVVVVGRGEGEGKYRPPKEKVTTPKRDGTHILRTRKATDPIVSHHTAMHQLALLQRTKTDAA